MRVLVQRLTAQAALVWLLLALVVVPALGRLHQVTHGSALDRMHAGRMAAAQALWRSTAKAAAESHAGATAARPAQGLLELLQPGHTPVECLLLDQLALGDALQADTVAAQTLQAPQATPAPHMERRGALHVALFQARGPPAA